MATPSKVQVSLQDPGVFHCPGITPETARKASEVLQENHEKHHIFYGQSGFHNHIAHHVLTLYALASSTSNIQRQYESNKRYQHPVMEIRKKIVDQLHDPNEYRKHLGDAQYYHDYLIFFQKEMEQKGSEAVLNEYLFKRDRRADDMLVRMFMGFLHPIIHLGFGIEFNQPAIIAEALAQAAVHENWLAPLFKVEETAGGSVKQTGKSLVSLLDEIRADHALSSAAHWDDDNKIRDGIMKRAPEEMIKYASQWTVGPGQLEEKTAEMINAAVYFTGGAQHPPKVVKFDFYFMHCVNSSIFFSAFIKQPWLAQEHKIRLLEWKGRVDLVMYASRRSPKPLISEITDYKPKFPSGAGGDPWGSIFDRVGKHEDDGHASKLIRALAHGEEVCKPYEEREEFRIKSSMWLQLGHMVIDSVERTDDSWVRSAGFNEAWEHYEDRTKAAS